MFFDSFCKNARRYAKEFGKMIGKSEGRVYQYYNETNFYTDTLKEFSVLLNVPMSYWFDDKDAPHSIVNGDKSAASVYGNATVSTSDEKDKEIEHLKQLLEEKEERKKMQEELKQASELKAETIRIAKMETAKEILQTIKSYDGWNELQRLRDEIAEEYELEVE